MAKKTPLIVLSGLDGSGKSTALEHIQAMQFPPHIKGVVMGHRRPGVVKSLPPHMEVGEDGYVAHYEKPNHGALSSLAKLGVMTLDWIIGYWGKLARQRAKGYLVVFDRHYLIDLSVDPHRYRYGGPLWCIEVARALVPDPDLIIFLDIPEEVSLARKNELGAPNFEAQRQAYLQLARRSSNWHVVDATQPLETVLREVQALILSQLGTAAVKKP